MCEDGAGRLYSSPEHPELKKYAIATEADLDWTLEADKEKRVIWKTLLSIILFIAIILISIFLVFAGESPPSIRVVVIFVSSYLLVYVSYIFLT